MTTLTCPKCRQGLPDDALDAGQCHLCGFPLDGPVVLGAPGPRTGNTRLLLAAGAAVLIVAGVGVAFFANSNSTRTPQAPELASSEPTEPARPVRYVAPFPHEPKPRDPSATTQSKSPADPGAGDKGQPQDPVAVEVPKRVGPRPVATAMHVNPRVEPKRHFDHPDDIAAVADLNNGDRVTLTGTVRVLRLGSVNGKGSLDASGLVAEEVIITGDLSGEALVLVNAPNGTVTVGGYVMGNAKVTVAAPGGTVTVANTGRVAGGATITATAKRLEVGCPMSGSARVNVTLTAGGSLKIARAEDGATVTYKKAAAGDPPPTIDKGQLLGGAKVIEEK